MDSGSLSAGKTLLLQHGVNTQKAKITSIDSVLDVQHLVESEDRNEIKLNEIGIVNLKMAGEVYADTYESNPSNGAFILIDPMTNNTAGLGFVM